MQLKGVEKAKIACVKKLFNELSVGKVRYHNVTSYDDLLTEMNKLDNIFSGGATVMLFRQKCI